MRDFSFTVARSREDAFAADGNNVMAIAGGTELLNWFRLGIAAPARVIDIGRLPGMTKIDRNSDRLSIGALATLNDIGGDEAVIRHAGALADACLKAASPQIRNRATIGGNVLQKTRCPYFRAEAPLPWGCNKRAPGSGCAARHGINERHAILGWTDDCVAVHPSDPLVALAALDAVVELAGPDGRRTMRVAELHVTPEEVASDVKTGRITLPANADAARIESRLLPGELIVAYHLPVRSGLRSAYVKVRERASYEYALVSAAATLTLDEGKIATAAVALGSVALKPWRLRAAEDRLVGVVPTRDAVMPIMRAALVGARPLDHNGYKIAMAAGAATRAVIEAAA